MTNLKYPDIIFLFSFVLLTLLLCCGLVIVLCVNVHLFCIQVIHFIKFMEMGIEPMSLVLLGYFDAFRTFWSLRVSHSIDFHCMEKCSINIRLNISFCDLRNKVIRVGKDMRVMTEFQKYHAGLSSSAAKLCLIGSLT